MINLKDRLHKLFHPTQQVVLPDHTEDETELLFKYERGRRLESTVSTEGWKDVVGILEDVVFTKTFDLVNYKEYDKDEATLRQKEAHMAALLLDQLLTQIREAIEESRKIPQIVATKVALRQSGNLTETSYGL